MKIYVVAIWSIICFSICLSIYSTWCGQGFTHDSFNYLSAAESFRHDGTLLNRNGSLYVFHAPLLPLLLSFFGENIEIIWSIVVKLISLLTLVIIYFSSFNTFRNKLLFVIAFASVGLNVGYQMINNFLWTESVFLLMLAIHNYLLINFIERKKTTDFYLLVCVALIMGITKNTGFFIILITSGILLFFYDRVNSRKSITYFIIGSIGFAWWNFYVVLFRGGSQMFRNNEFLVGIDTNLFNYIDIISRWFLPEFIPPTYRFGFLVLLTIFLIVLLIKSEVSFSAKIFIIQFFTFLFIMIVVVKVDSDEIERLISIVAPWFYISMFLVLDAQWKKFNFPYKIAVMIVFLLWTSYTISRGISNSIMWHQGKCISVASK